MGAWTSGSSVREHLPLGAPRPSHTGSHSVMATVPLAETRIGGTPRLMHPSGVFVYARQ